MSLRRKSKEDASVASEKEQGRNEVVLNIYQMHPDPDADHSLTDFAQFMGSKILPPTGLGAYHTTIDVNGYCYAYGIKGLGKTLIADKHEHKPEHAVFQESINLGTIALGERHPGKIQRRQIDKCLTTLHLSAFTKKNYHILNNNCNHFTESLAIALLVADDLALEKPPSCKTYPKWVNRLSRFSSGLVNIQHGNGNDNSSVPYCDVVKEAKIAVGLLPLENVPSEKLDRAGRSSSPRGRWRSKKRNKKANQRVTISVRRSNRSSKSVMTESSHGGGRSVVTTE